ncbi:MAG: hypothetical protein ACTHMC_20675 [Pseudobacter sp.]|uniref:hypothetical protein n=1 Tax=Pseudobacter sp. TaxID=2045420 RepID=UPI003F7F4827
MKYTQTTLDKLETLLDELEYVVRYERGTFQSGYCILEQKKVVVLNKFLQMEGRINTLMDIIPQLNVGIEFLTPESRKVYDDVIQRREAADAAADADSKSK